MRVRLMNSVPLLVLALAATACSGDDKSDDSADVVECEAPLAVAGADMSSALGGSVQLDASGSTWCSEYTQEDLIFTWDFEQVPSDSSVDATSLSDNDSDSAINPTFLPDVDGYYVLSLVVTDPEFASAPSMVVVTIYVDDAPPIADCGPDLDGEVDVAATLDGSGSSDPEGAELEFSWSISQAPSCSAVTSADIFNSSGATPSIVPDCDGVYVVGLVVGDGAQWSEYDYCTIDVASENRAPVADAGDTEDRGACAEDPMPLNGWGSYDLDGDDLTFSWSLVDTPTGSAATDADFDDPTSASPLFDWDVRGSYTFQLQVSDGELESAPDIVTLTVNEEVENTGPIANAGEDLSIELEADCVSSSYEWSCNDCEELDIEVDGSASSDIDGDSLKFHWTESTGSVSFNNSHSALTDAVISEQAAEYGVDSSVALELLLTVQDCLESDSDSITVSYTCTGVAAE